MGIACGDLDGDGRPDLAVTNYYGESTTFFRNLGGGLFADDTAAMGLAAPTRYLLGFGIAFLDANNDGRLDLISANGHVSDYAPVFPWKMPIQLLTGGPDGRLTDASARAGDPFRPLHWAAAWPRATSTTTAGSTRSSSPRTSRSSTCTTRPPAGGHWVTLRLEGVRSNRDGVGARVVVEAGGRRQIAAAVRRRQLPVGRRSPAPLRLGDRTRVERLEVRWPSGQVDRYDGLEADRGYLLREGAPTADAPAGLGSTSGLIAGSTAEIEG